MISGTIPLPTIPNSSIKSKNSNCGLFLTKEKNSKPGSSRLDRPGATQSHRGCLYTKAACADLLELRATKFIDLVIPLR